jgi:hypothetical protein
LIVKHDTDKPAPSITTFNKSKTVFECADNYQTNIDQKQLEKEK